MLKKTVFLSVLFLFLYSFFACAEPLSVDKELLYFFEDFEIDNIARVLSDNEWVNYFPNNGLDYDDWMSVNHSRAFGFEGISNNSQSNTVQWYHGFCIGYVCLNDGFISSSYGLAIESQLLVLYQGNIDTKIQAYIRHNNTGYSSYIGYQYSVLNNNISIMGGHVQNCSLIDKVNIGDYTQIILLLYPNERKASLFVNGSCGDCCNLKYSPPAYGNESNRASLYLTGLDTINYTHIWLDNFSIYSFTYNNPLSFNTTIDTLKNLSITQNLEELLSMGNALNSYGRVFIGIIIVIIILAYLLFNGIGGKSPLLFIIVFTVLLVNTLVILGLFPSWLFILEIIVIAIIGAVLLYGVLVR